MPHLGSLSQLVPSNPDSIRATLARYATLIDEPQAFLTSAATPLPVCLWLNPLKGNLPALLSYLATLGLSPEPVGWLPGAFRVEEWRSPGHTLAFTAGWYYVQEEIAMTAVQVLNPQPGEQILDLCAAPGGKTAQIAIRLQNTGSVVANELHAARLPSLSATIARLGLTNVMTTQGDGRSHLFPNHTFDRVLVDAPCSGEGNLRRRRNPRPWQAKYGLRIAAAQKKLLDRALDLVKPGGTVVYSTCTFAPEENEAVLNAVMGDRAYLEPINIPGIQGQAGLTQWQGQSYRHDLNLAQRYFPHINNTGGFFVARLRRTETPLLSQVEAIAMPEMPSVPWGHKAPLTDLSQRFAIAEEHWKHYQCWSTGKKRLWLSDTDCIPTPGPSPQTLGIAIASQTNLGLKPSTAFLQRFGEKIQRNFVELPDTEAAQKFLQGQTQVITAPVETGYVQVRFGPFQLGCGRYVKRQLQSHLPKLLRWTPMSIESGE